MVKRNVVRGLLVGVVAFALTTPVSAANNSTLNQTINAGTLTTVRAPGHLHPVCLVVQRRPEHLELLRSESTLRTLTAPTMAGR